MVPVREVTLDDWQVLREIRLAALKDTPWAFGSSYEREVAFTEEDWRGRILSRSVTFLGYLPEVSPAGIVGAVEEDPGTAELVSMWVSPRARGRGIGETLITTVVDWAKARQYEEVRLWVTEANSPARSLYERCGFVPTGESQPLPSNPSLTEIGMRRTI